MDHMRGFVIALVVLQHAVQGYAQQWGGRLWFIDLPDRSSFFDIMFMWTDSFIMQALFFLAGIFVLPSLNRRGWLSFTQEKITRLAIPMLIGIAFLVPPLRYLKYEAMEEPGIGYMEYWFNIYLNPSNISPAGFWFIAFLLLLTFLAVIIDKIFPKLLIAIGKVTDWLAANPMMGYLIIAGIVSILIGYSDIRWGTYWWMGLSDFVERNENSWFFAFLRFFSARSNMLYSYVFFFILGLGASKSGLLQNNDSMDKAVQSWKTWLASLILLSLVYSWYNQTYLLTGAFNDEIRQFFRQGGSLSDAWPLIWDVAPAVLVRTTLHGFLCTTQIFTILILLYKFTNHEDGKDFSKWASLGACSYGIFFIHEPIVVWSQFMFENIGLPNGIKMILVFTIALSLSWIITAKILRKMPVTNKVF